MIVTNAAISRSTTVFVGLLLIFIAGVYSYATLPRESNPEVIIPYITVTVPYEGVSPEDMESLVTVPIERKLATITGIKEMTSNSLEGMSTILVEFEADTIIEDALQKVRDKVDQAEPDLPPDADDPVIDEINVAEFPIMVMSLTGDYPLAVLNGIAEDLEERLETIRGVLDVQVIGGVEREIQIVVDPDRIAAYGIPLSDLVAVTQLENVNTPGGAMDLGEAKYLMRTPGEITTPEELESLVVKVGPEGVVYLRDIAEVRDDFKEATSLSRVNGKPSVTLTVIKRSGSNIIEIADEVNASMARYSERFPPGVEVALTWDESDWIRAMVAELENSILSGLVLVVAVVFLFLGVTNAVFVALAIPVSMLITFATLDAMGVTLNMVVLFSLILALGMLVDNGIVVVENIYRFRQAGCDRMEASRRGAAEVAWPIFSSTLTTVAAFAPMFFWPGIWGEFMYYLPLTVSLALGGSLVVGLIVNPALTSVLMPDPKAENEKTRGHPILQRYERFLRFVLEYRAATVATAFGLLIVITTLFSLTTNVIFEPEIEPPQAFIDIEAPEGTNLQASDAIVRQVEAIAAKHQDHLDFIIANVGSQGTDPGTAMSGGGASTHLSRVSLDFPPLEEAEVMPTAILAAIRPELEKIVGANVRMDKMGMGPPVEPPVNVEISGDDYEVLAGVADDVRRVVAGVAGTVDVRDDYDKGKPQVRVEVDRQQAWQTGLSTQVVGVTVQTAINGRKAGEYREGDEEYDVTVVFPDAFREDLTNVEDMRLINAQGQPIPLSAVARIEQGTGLGVINRIDRRRTITVSADVLPGENPQETLGRVRDAVGKNVQLPPGVSIAYTGENEDMEETSRFLSKAFVVAVFLITLVLVTQFNSLKQPIIIMTSVLLSLAGVFLGLMLFRMDFSVLMSGIGCISLAGVVVNNAIVLIDYINQLRARGLSTREAVVEGGCTRFRPVMLTAITTVLGLVPMAIGVSVDFRAVFTGDFGHWLRIGGDTSQFWGPMAVAVIFGLTFATVLTLVVVPTLYSLLMEPRAESERNGAKPSGAESSEAPAPAK